MPDKTTQIPNIDPSALNQNATRIVRKAQPTDPVRSANVEVPSTSPTQIVRMSRPGEFPSAPIGELPPALPTPVETPVPAPVPEITPLQVAAQTPFDQRTDEQKQMLQDRRAQVISTFNPNSLTDLQQRQATTFIKMGGDPNVLGSQFTPSLVNFDEALDTAVGVAGRDLTTPLLPRGSAFSPEMQQVADEELINIEQFQIGAAPRASAGRVSGPEDISVGTVVAETIGDAVPTAGDIRGELSAAAKVTAATATISPAMEAALEEERDILINFPVDPRATVREQYSLLMADMEGGEPAWATSAIRAAEQKLAARGLGASSIAGGAITAAVMEAALPIAVQDAKVFATLDLQKFSRTAALGALRISQIAQLDITSLNNRQTAAVENARSALQMDLTNLNNEQQTEFFNAQNQIQVMLSDQAAVNFARNQNVSNQLQADMMLTELGQRAKEVTAQMATQVSMANAQMANQREMFNASNAIAIEQSNINYLRSVNTANTALQNQANLVNSQNLLNLSTAAMANMFQLYRDQESYLWQSAENTKDRSLQRALIELQTGANIKLQDNKLKNDMYTSLGTVGSTLLGNVLKPVASAIGSKIEDAIGI